MLSVDVSLRVFVLSFSFPFNDFWNAVLVGPHANDVSSYIRLLLNMVIGLGFAVVPWVPIAQLRIPIRLRRCDTAAAQHYASCHGGRPALQRCIRGRTRPMSQDRIIIFIYIYVCMYVCVHVCMYSSSSSIRVHRPRSTTDASLQGRPTAMAGGVVLCSGAVAAPRANWEFAAVRWEPTALLQTRDRSPYLVVT